MAQVLGFEIPLNKDDLLIFDGKSWKTINKNVLLKEIVELKNEIVELKKELQKTKDDVNIALAKYHKALQVIVKGE